MGELGHANRGYASAQPRMDALHYARPQMRADRLANVPAFSGGPLAYMDAFGRGEQSWTFKTPSHPNPAPANSAAQQAPRSFRAELHGSRVAYVPTVNVASMCFLV